ncbi:hypothetical protein LPJ61_005152, partial [Coemansia biformis]
PVPAQVSKLIVPNNVPPALFETTAKISASYLLQHYFADFYAQAHYNLSVAEQRAVLIVASVLLVLGVGTAVTVAIAATHIAWRAFAAPLLVASMVGLSAAWTRIGIWRWLARTRPTSLVASASARLWPDKEELVQTASGPDVDLSAVRAVTGTLWPQQSVGLVGTLKAPSCLCGCAIACCSDCDSAAPGAVQSVLDRAVRFMLRKHSAGDQWHIDLDSEQYRVLEPLVLRGQCYSVGHQLAILVVVWCAAATAIFLTP